MSLHTFEKTSVEGCGRCGLACSTLPTPPLYKGGGGVEVRNRLLGVVWENRDRGRSGTPPFERERPMTQPTDFEEYGDDGLEYDEPRCSTCRGTGIVNALTAPLDGPFVVSFDDCPHCDGLGYF